MIVVGPLIALTVVALAFLALGWAAKGTWDESRYLTKGKKPWWLT